MPFKGNAPYGTDDPIDDLSIPTDPPVSRIAEGGSYVAFLLINGPVTIRQREQVESVVRIIGARGEITMGLVFRDDAAIIDSAVTDASFGNGLQVVTNGPGVVTINIPSNGISTAMLTDALVTAAKLANNAVQTAHIQDAAVTDAKLASSFVKRSEVYPINPGTISVASGVSTTRNICTTVSVSLAAGTYAYILITGLDGEGVGAPADGNLRVQKDGVTLFDSGIMRWEQGVDTTHNDLSIDTFTLASPDASVIFTFDWVRNAGTINMYQADFGMLLIRIA